MKSTLGACVPSQHTDLIRSAFQYDATACVCTCHGQNAVVVRRDPVHPQMRYRIGNCGIHWALRMPSLFDPDRRYHAPNGNELLQRVRRPRRQRERGAMRGEHRVEPGVMAFAAPTDIDAPATGTGLHAEKILGRSDTGHHLRQDQIKTAGPAVCFGVDVFPIGADRRHASFGIVGRETGQHPLGNIGGGDIRALIGRIERKDTGARTNIEAAHPGPGQSRLRDMGETRQHPGAVARVCVAGTTWAAIRRAGR